MTCYSTVTPAVGSEVRYVIVAIKTFHSMQCGSLLFKGTVYPKHYLLTPEPLGSQVNISS